MFTESLSARRQWCIGACWPWNNDYSVCFWSNVTIDTNGYSTGQFDDLSAVQRRVILS